MTRAHNLPARPSKQILGSVLRQPINFQMNKRNSIILLAGLWALLTQAHAQNWLTNGLLAYYPFNGNANDVTGNGFDATAVAASSAVDRFGVATSAFSLAGAYQHIELPNDAAFAPPKGSVAIWVKATSWETSDPFVDLLGKDGLTGRQWVVQVQTDGKLRTALFTNNGEHTVVSAMALSTDRWHHIVMTWDGEKQVGYIDGIKASSLATTGIISSGPQPVRVGGNPHFGTSLNGSVDDVRIYSRALTESEVKALHEYESGCTPHQAKATPLIVNGFLVGAIINDPGCGYVSPPIVLIKSGTGSGATASAVIANGRVTEITIDAAGSGYSDTDPPEILIASPPFEPRVEIRTSRIIVEQYVVLGRKYVLESSDDLALWTQSGEPFVAVSEKYATEFIIADTGLYFRLREVQ